MLLIEKFAQAIRIHEGWFAGSLSQKNHNPGNLKFARQRKSLGPDLRGFAIFANDTDGHEALINQIKIGLTGDSKLYYPTMTILQFFERYAPSEDNNNPKIYAEFVAKHCGLGIDHPIGIMVRDLHGFDLPASIDLPPAKKKIEVRIDDLVVFFAEI